jgi:Ni,Fe-hydrogenase III large subunit
MVLMRGKSPRAAARFAARLSGDTTVAHSLAFARAAEAALDVHIPSRAAVLRAIMLELERIANHLNDAGAICNAVSFRLASSRFLRHREALLRAAAAAFGHRLMMDCVVPGGVAGDIAAGGATAILHAMEALCAEWPDLLRLYDAHVGLADRMAGIGTVSPALAAQFASGGVIGRASGRRFDARTLPGAGPYAATGLAVPARQEGDVDARLRIRFEEIAESARLLTEFLDELPDGPLSAPLPMESGEGIGVAEGFRGDVWHWLRLDGGLIAACFPRDPSWLQWPLLETATEGGIVADLPLIERSFGCSISGVDL